MISQIDYSHLSRNTMDLINQFRKVFKVNFDDIKYPAEILDRKLDKLATAIRELDQKINDKIKDEDRKLKSK